MGLMDRVKTQATVLAQKTQETARDGKAKFDQAQAGRRGDAILRNLGAAVFAERTGRGTPDSQTQIDSLVQEASAYEALHGISLTAQPDDQQGSDPAAGGFPGPAAAGSAADSGAAGFPAQADPSPAGFPSGASPASFPPPAGSPAGAGATDFPPPAGTEVPPPAGGTGFPPVPPTSVFPSDLEPGVPTGPAAESFPPAAGPV